MQITSGRWESVKSNNLSNLGRRLLALKYKIFRLELDLDQKLELLELTPSRPRNGFGFPTPLAEIPPADSVSLNVGSEQRELDLKGPPHFYLQVKSIILQVKESVHHSLQIPVARLEFP